MNSNSVFGVVFSAASLCIHLESFINYKQYLEIKCLNIFGDQILAAPTEWLSKLLRDCLINVNPSFTAIQFLSYLASSRALANSTGQIIQNRLSHNSLKL